MYIRPIPTLDECYDESITSRGLAQLLHCIHAVHSTSLPLDAVTEEDETPPADAPPLATIPTVDLTSDDEETTWRAGARRWEARHRRHRAQS